MTRTAVFVLLYSLLSPRALGQTSQFQFESISVEHGLSQSSVWSILQDSYGFMWFGTADGLNKYDGYSFQIFRHDPQDSNSLTENTVRALLEDRDGILWVGTAVGLHRYDRTTGVFHHLGAEDRYKGTRLAASTATIIQDRSGVLWIGTAAGLVTLDPKTGAFHQFSPSEFPKVSTSVDFRTYCEDRNGDIWCSNAELVFKFVREKKRFEVVPIPLNRTEARISFVFIDHRGEYWIGTNTAGLISWQPGIDSWRLFTHDPRIATSISSDNVWSIGEDDLGRLWVGTSTGGLNVLNRQTRMFTHFAPYMD